MDVTQTTLLLPHRGKATVIPQYHFTPRPYHISHGLLSLNESDLSHGWLPSLGHFVNKDTPP